MKKVNLLSKAEMKKVMGGNEEVNCSDWRTKDYSTCWTCCNSVHNADYCEKPENCGHHEVVIIHNG